MSRRGEAAHRRQNRQAGRLLGLRPFIAGGSEAAAARRNALDSASSTGRRSVELCPSTASRRRGPSTRPTPSWIGGASSFATADGHAAGVGSGGIGRFRTGIPTISCLTILGEIGKPSDEMAAKCAARWWKATRRTRQCVQAMSYSRAIGHAVTLINTLCLSSLTNVFCGNYARRTSRANRRDCVVRRTERHILEGTGYCNTGWSCLP
jgi:hypothetical protein